MSKQKTPLAELEEFMIQGLHRGLDVRGVLLRMEKFKAKEREAFINAAQEVNLEKVSMTGEEWFNENFSQ